MVKRKIREGIALLLCLLLVITMTPMMAHAANTVTVQKVVYTNNSDGTASAAITFRYTGNNITYIDPMIGKSEGTYEYDLDTRDVLNLPAGWALKKNEDGTYTLIASPLNLTGGIGKPPAGTEAWVGVSVTDDEWDESSDQLKITVPGEGQTVEVVRGGDTPTTIAIPTGKTLTYNGGTQTGVDAGTGYTLSGTYQAVNAGSYTATATPASGYKWTDGTTRAKQISWKINKSALTELGYPDSTTFTYNGQVQKPVEEGINVYAVSGAPATTGTDYTIRYSNANSKNAGSYTVTATGAGNFTGSASLTYKIEPTTITGITLSAAAFEFNGQVQKPTVQSITTSNGTALTTNDYTIDIPDSSAVGSYTVTVTGKNNATGTQTAQYVIETEKDLSKADVVGLKKDENGNVDDNQPYTKEEAEGVGLKYGGKTLIPGEGKDYIKTVTEKQGDPSKWEIKAEPIEGKTKGHRVIEVKKAPDTRHNVTINYVYAGSGETAAPKYLRSFEQGAAFAIKSPRVKDCIAGNGIIVGVMGDKDLEYTVTYAQYTAVAVFTVDVVYTVEYKEGDTTTETPKPVRLYREDGKSYSITSPEVEGYKADIQVVQGKVNHENVIVEVRYKPAYTLFVKMIIRGHNDGADEELGDREIPMYAGEPYDFVPYMLYGEVDSNTYLSGMAEGLEREVNQNFTPDPARLKGVMPAHDEHVTVYYSCKHSKTRWKNNGDAGHSRDCYICESTLETKPHDLDEGVYIPLDELLEDAEDISQYDEIRQQYPNGVIVQSCSICDYEKETLPDKQICPASPEGEEYEHLWSTWEKISDTQCQRSCYRCKTVETGNHDWSNWQYASTVTHYRICHHCHITETGNHGSWTNIRINTPPTCIAHASVDAFCTDCGCDVHDVYYGILKDMRGSGGYDSYEPTGHQFDGGWVNINGGHTQKCSVCGAFDMEHWEAHAWSDDGETAEGVCGNGTVTRHFVCRCGAEKHEDSDWEHNWWHDTKRETEATCEHAGTECYTCRNCGATNDKHVDALGHVWVEDEGNYAASCTQPGHMSFHCDRPNCTATKGGDIPALHPEGHKMEPFSINTSTCTIGGYLTTGQKCAYCGYTENEKSEPTGKLGHSMKETEQKVDWRSRVIYQNGRPAVVNEEVFYVTRECTRCGYCAPGHLYTVARSEQLSRYKIETGNVKVRALDEGSGGVKVSGQFGKDGGVYFDKTVNDAYQSRKEIDRKVYEQHEGSVITTFDQEFLNGLEDGEYDFIQTNGDELAAARVTVENGQITRVEDGVINADPTKEENQMLPEEYLFYLGAAEHVMTGTAELPVIEREGGGTYARLALGANGDPIVMPHKATYDRRTGSENHREVVAIKYDKGHTFNTGSPVSLFGKPIPSEENVRIKTYNEQTQQLDVSEVNRTNYIIDNDKITFTTEYLDSLGEGLHEFTLNYEGGVTPATMIVDIVRTAEPVDPGHNGGGGGNYTPVDPDRPFTDVQKGDWFYDAVYHCYDNGYFKGISPTLFDPKGSMTRAMFATVLWRVTGEPASLGTNPFTDVEENTWYTEAIIWASENKIIEGYGNGKFGTNDPITREQMVTMLYRYDQLIAGSSKLEAMSSPAGEVSPKVTEREAPRSSHLASYSDSDQISPWAVDAFDWAVGAGIINGKGGGILDPKGTATRAEVAQIVENYDVL